MKHIRKPNFFIIGAPKCGTTSLASWLSAHPNIFMPDLKEPHHFNTDENWVLTPERDQYESLFSKATEQHEQIGEASVWYLFSQDAVKNIEEYSPNARYIVCLRNPVEMAPSLHEQSIFSGREHILNFKKAWELCDSRMIGKHVSILSREPSHLIYTRICSLGEQLKRLYSIVPRNRILPILLDDVKEDPAEVYHRVLCFLNLKNDGRTDFPIENKSKQRRSLILNQAILTFSFIKRKLGIKYKFGVQTFVNTHNRIQGARAPLTNDMTHVLRSYFAEDIKLLECLLERDLSHWLA